MKFWNLLLALAVLLAAVACSGGSEDKAGSPVKEGDYAAEPGNAGQTR
jgi:hypothetical protein